MQFAGTSFDPGVKHGTGLLRLAKRLAGGSDEAEDLVQDTYVRALERGRTAHPHSPPQGWLRRVLRNERNMTLRGRIRREGRERSTIDAEPVDVEQVVQALKVARLLHEMLDSLDDEVAHVVRARYFEGLSAAEIARRQGIPAGTVRWRLKRGLDELRDRLDRHHGGRRALWATTLMPVKISPTLEGSAALKGEQAAATSHTAAKGSTLMTTKFILAAIALTTAAGTAYVTTDDDVTSIPANATAATQVAAVTPQDAETEAEPSTNKDVKAQWQARRNDIRKVLSHTKVAAPTPVTHTKTSAQDKTLVVAQCDGQPCGDDEAGLLAGHSQTELLQLFVPQIYSMVSTCGEFLPSAPDDLSMSVDIIGAPDIGSVVESVDLSSEDTVPADLDECLTEAAYAFDFGDVQEPFEDSFSMKIGASGGVADANIPPEQLAQLQATLKNLDPEAFAGDQANIVIAADGSGPVDLEDLDAKTRAEIEALLEGDDDEMAGVQFFPLDD